MLKYFVLFCFALLAFVAANEADKEAQLLTSYNQNDGAHYKHGHEVSNGINFKAQGDVNGQQGEYFLPGEDGKLIRVTYTADSTGFHPKVEEH